MKKVLSFLAVFALMAGISCMAQTVTLPYSANFADGWTATGSSYVTADSAVLVGIDDTIYSPWFTASDAGVVFMTFAFSSNNENYGYASLDILDEQGNLVCDAWLDANYTGKSYWPGFPACGLTNTNFRLALHWSPYGNFQGKTFTLHEMHIYQYEIHLGIVGPDTLDPGQSGVFTVSLLDGTEADTIYFDSDESNGYSSVANGNTLTVTGNASGNYYVIAYAKKENVYNGWPAQTSVWKEFVVRDTTTYLCPDVVDTLPFEADFNQCWTLVGGAELTEDGYIKLSGQGQRAVGPWVDIDTAGDLIIIATARRDNPDALPSDTYLGNYVTTLGKIQIRDSNYGTFYIDASSPVNNGSWNASNYYNGQQVRLEYEYYYGDEPVYITSSALYQIDVEPTAEIVLNGTAYEGMPYTFDVSYDLGGDNVPDSIVWSFNGGTVVSGEGTTTPTVVFNSIGYKYCTVRLYKRIFGDHMVSAYADIYLDVVADTVMHECTVDRYSMPYLSHFTTCWTTSGNANIVSSNEARLTAVGDTLHSPWIHIDADTVVLGFSFTTDRIPLEDGYYTYSNVHYHVNVVDSTGSVVFTQSPTYGYYGGSTMTYRLYDLSGHTVHVDFIYNAADTADFILSDMVLFQSASPAEITISGPDTVTMGQEATFYVNVPDGISFYSWNTSNATNTYSYYTPTFTTTWNSPGPYTVYFSYDQSGFAGYSDGYYIEKMVYVMPTDSLLAQMVQLPYSANFAEGWTLEGGATLTDDGRIRLDGYGQKAIGPWIHVGLDGETHWQYTLDPEDGNNEAIHYILSRVQYGSSYSTTEQNWYVTNQSLNDRFGYGTYDNGKIFRFELKYNEENSTTPIYLSALDYIQTMCDMEIFGPDTVYIGQIAHYTSSTGIVHHATETEPDTEPSTPSYFWKSNINEYNYNSVGSRYNDSIDVYWNEPGEYRLYLEKVYYNYYNGLNVSHKSSIKTIVVMEEPPSPCDTIVYTLPYTADFTQCWTAADGANIVDDNTANMFANHSTITSPLIHCDSNTYIHYTVMPGPGVTDSVAWSSSVSLTMKLYDTEGNLVKTVYRNEKLNVPESDYRIRLDYSNYGYTYSASISSFWVEDTIIVMPEMVIAPSPDTLYVGDTIRMKLQTVDSTQTAPHVRDYWVIYKDGEYLTRVACWSDYTMVYTLHTSTYTSAAFRVGEYTIIVYDMDSVEIDRRTIVVLPLSESPACVIDEFPYYEDFSGDIDCWTGPQYYYSVSQLSSGAKGLYVGEGGYASSPKLDLDGRYHMMTFHAQNTDMANNSLLLRYGSETDSSYFIFILKGTLNEYQLLLPPTTTFFKFIPRFDNTNTYTDGNVFVDDITITPLGVVASDSSVTLIDTQYVDTVIYNVVYQDTTVYNVSTVDTTIYDVSYVDTTVFNFAYVDTTVYNVEMVDSTVYNITTLDSTVINIIQSDSIIYYYDTTCATHDTLLLTDTIYIIDTIYITDTVYVGVDDVTVVNVKMYVQGSDIVVENSDGNRVSIYDAVGRLLATKQEAFEPVRFPIATSGVYMVKVGNLPARKIVVVR